MQEVYYTLTSSLCLVTKRVLNKKWKNEGGKSKIYMQTLWKDIHASKKPERMKKIVYRAIKLYIEGISGRTQG